MDGRKRAFIYSGGGFGDCCKVLCDSGLWRCALLDGVFLVGWKVEVYLGEVVTVCALSKKCVSPSTYRLGMWLVALWNVPCGYMEGAHP